MQFEKNQRVSTPEGNGSVVYQRLIAPDYRNAIAVSVRLDKRVSDISYHGTIFPADKVTPLMAYVIANPIL